MLNPPTKGWGIYELTHRQTEKLLAEREARGEATPTAQPGMARRASRANRAEPRPVNYFITTAGHSSLESETDTRLRMIMNELPPMTPLETASL